jgi:hypothetical protein
MTEMVERVARAISAEHFKRKQHYGLGTVEERVACQVERNWRNSVPEALAAIKAIRDSAEAALRAREVAEQ